MNVESLATWAALSALMAVEERLIWLGKANAVVRRLEEFGWPQIDCIQTVKMLALKKEANENK